MKTKTRLAVVIGAVLTVVGAIGWAWRENRLAGEAAEARAAVVRTTVAGEARQRALEARSARAADEAEALKKTLAQLATAAKAQEKSAATSQGNAAAGAGVNGRWVRAIRSDPTVQALEVAASRWRFETQYAPLCRSLGLTPAQQEEFYGNLMVWEAKIADMKAAADAQEISDLDERVARLTMEAQRECEAAQRELLGEENFRRAQEFAAASVARQLVGGLAKVATAAGVPLSLQQAEALVPLLRGSPAAREDEIAHFRDLDWARIDTQVRAVLTDEQFVLYRTTEPVVRFPLSRFHVPLERLIDQARAADAAAATGRPGG
jgi:hypothetical protein